MRIMKFEGATMRDAIAKVKAELGDQAVIISSRQIRKGLLGHAVEISAAVDDENDAKPTAADTTSPAFTRGMNSAYAQNTGDGADVEKMLAPLKSEMRSLRAMIRSNATPTPAATQNISKLESEIAVLRELVEKLATNQLNNAPSSTPTQATTTKNIAKTATVETLSAAVAGLAKRREQIVEEPLLVAPSTARVVMLVGPTGAGKTTTIAKLAAHAHLVEGRSVRIITLDTFRIGGVDQVRTYADLIGVPLTVLESSADLAAAIDDNDDLTLIDTAGRSPKDTSSVVELATAIGSIDGLETHLVIPASSTASIIDELVRRYTALSPARLLFTKIDEHDHVTQLLEAPRRTRLPITWVATGQQVPEDLETPTAMRLGELAANGVFTASHRSHRAA